MNFNSPLLKYTRHQQSDIKTHEAHDTHETRGTHETHETHKTHERHETAILTGMNFN